MIINTATATITDTMTMDTTLITGIIMARPSRLSGGCHLNRAIEDIVRKAGFRADHLEKGHMRGPRPMTFMYEGQARPR